MKKLTIGIAGVGVVGSGLLELLVKNSKVIEERTGYTIQVKSVCVKNLNKERHFLPKDCYVTTNPFEITEDKDIDIFVELMGGKKLAKEAILSALNHNKSVVTANKALLAEEGDELFKLAAEKGLHLYFEAAVAGAIPVVQTFKESLNGNLIENFLGILNGTSNYILSEMTSNNKDFDAALKQAQELGYAEAEPSLDVDGFDAAHKLNLLIRLAWGVEYPYKDLLIEGVRNMASMDIEFAREFGYTIKLLGQASYIDDKIEAGLFPALVNKRLLLAKVGGAYNAIRVEGNALGSLFLHGQGAGSLPTASAVMADILAVTRAKESNIFGYKEQILKKAQVIAPEHSIHPYYLRLMVKDDAGVLRDIAGALANQDISIAQVIQKSQIDKKVPLVFITHKASYKAMQEALKEIEAFIYEKPICYRIFN